MPPVPIGRLLTDLPVAAQLATRMRFQGRSAARGVKPAWLTAITDIRVLAIEDDDATHVLLDAPQLGDAAPELYEQEKLWETRPAPEDTALDLLGDVLTDVAVKDEDSGRYDSALLQQIVRFDKVLDGEYQELAINGRGRVSGQRPILTRDTIETARSLQEVTPAPARVRVAGHLDMIRASTQTFALQLEDGNEVLGVASDEEWRAVASLFSQEVVVSGEAIFRASGRLLRLEADVIEQAGGQTSIWSRVPEPTSGVLRSSDLRRRQGPRSGLAAIVGEWPGDESDEEVEAFLRQIS